MIKKLLSTVLFVLILIQFTWCKGQQENDFNSVVIPTSIHKNEADLIIDGEINLGEVFFDQATLAKFPAITFEAYDPWDKVDYTYTGVSLINLLNYLEINESADRIMAVAENGYTVPIRRQDLEKYEYIIAYKINNKLLGSESVLSVKGKLMIAINFNKHPDMGMDIYKNQLVWQLNHITIK